MPIRKSVKPIIITIIFSFFFSSCSYAQNKAIVNSEIKKSNESKSAGNITNLLDETEKSLVCEMKSKVNLSGFSGAPLLNEKGEVFGTLASGIQFEGKDYVLATHIKEIQKIKF